MVEQKIAQFIQKTLRDHALVGVAVGVVRNDQTVFAGGFGKRNIQKADSVTDASIFHVASISKLFTASAIMQLEESGLIGLDDPPQKYLPYLKITNPFEDRVMIKDLLSHTAGIPDVTDYGWDRPQFDDGALERYIRGLEVKLLFNPRSQYSYSNIAFEILGAILAVISGMPFETYLRENLIKPLGMKSSTFFKSEVCKENQTSPHVADLETLQSEVYPYNRMHAPSSTLHSNILDMNRWAKANLDKKVLFKREKTFHEMKNPIITVGNPQRTKKHVGLGWFLDEYKGLSYQYHSGHDVGFTSYHLLVPRSILSVTILCNTAPAPVEEIAHGILDIVELDQNPHSINPHIIKKLGQVFLSKGPKAMIEKYSSMKRMHVDNFDFEIGGFLETASALLDSNRNEMAVDLLLAILPLFPASAKGHETLARAYFQKGSYENAIRHGKRSLELLPDNPFLRQQLDALQ